MIFFVKLQLCWNNYWVCLLHKIAISFYHLPCDAFIHSLMNIVMPTRRNIWISKLNCLSFLLYSIFCIQCAWFVSTIKKRTTKNFENINRVLFALLCKVIHFILSMLLYRTLSSLQSAGNTKKQFKLFSSIAQNIFLLRETGHSFAIVNVTKSSQDDIGQTKYALYLVLEECCCFGFWSCAKLIRSENITMTYIICNEKPICMGSLFSWFVSMTL